MPDNIERKRLKKKMLERWENEGGRIAADSVIASQSNLPSQREGKALKSPLRTRARELTVFRLAKKARLTQR
jgi:hypothetical protein